MTKEIHVHSWGGAASKLKKQKSPSRAPLGFILLILLVAGGTWFFWPSPQRGEMDSFIPADHGLEIYVHDPATRRSDLKKNPLLETIPEETALGAYLNLLTQDLPVPGWLLNNLSSGLFHISMEDSHHQDDILIITRMTRIGLLTERLVSLSGKVTKERAGGLSLKKIKDPELFYSVRNKYLLISPSRDILIRSLTLPGQEAIAQNKFREGQHRALEADLFCRLSGEIFSPAPDLFSELTVALRLNQAVPRVSLQGSFTEASQHKYGALLQQSLVDNALATPMNGIASLSLNLGQPLPLWCEQLAQIEGKQELWEHWFSSPEPLSEETSAMETLNFLLKTLFQSSGERMRLAWFGLDEKEVLPAPLLAGTLEARTDALHGAYDLVPPAPLSEDMIDFYPHIDREQLFASLPFLGGNNMTPSMTFYSDGVLLGSSEGLVRDLIQWEGISGAMSKKANLYAHLRPAQAWEAVIPSLCELADAGLLRGHTEASFMLWAQSWQEQIAPLQEIALLGAILKKGIHLEAKIALGQAVQNLDIDATHFESREHP